MPTSGNPTPYDQWQAISKKSANDLGALTSDIANYDFLLSTLLSPPLPPPIVNAGNDLTGLVNNTISFSAIVTNGQSPFTYNWSFGDSTSGTGASTAHAYSSAGSYVASVIVTDSLGRAASDVVLVNVLVLPPSVLPLPDLTINIGQLVTITPMVNDGKFPFTYLWDFGDSTFSNVLIGSHVYTTANVYAVKFTVTDSLNRSNSSSMKITVVPVAVFDPTKGASNLSVKDNGDGTISATATLPPGIEYARYYYVPSTNANDYTRFQQSTNSPTSPLTMLPYALANGTWTFAVLVWGRVNGVLVQSSKGATLPFAMPGGNIPPPSGGGNGGPPPTPIPNPIVPPLQPTVKNRLLLPKEIQNRIRGIASSATQQWANFITEINKWMNYPIYGNYQASQGIIGPNYALAGTTHEDDYPSLASDYKDKALAEMEALLDDYQKGPNETCQRLQRGDGVTKTFPIPDSDFISSSFKVYLADITTKTVKRSNPPYPYGNYDEVQYYSHFLKVTDNTTIYIQDRDWRRNDSFPNDTIEWAFNPIGLQPLLGSQYTVELCSVFGSSPVACTVDSVAKTFTLSIAPRADQFVFVEYCYHDSVRHYRQTSEGTGGFNSVTIDTTYTSRSLGCNVALILDWCWDHPKFDDVLKQRAMTMLVRWADWLKINGYVMAQGKPGIPTLNPTGSNYTQGHYVSWALTAAALQGRHPDAARILSEVSAWRQTYVIPALTSASTSLKGGFWPEGWSYGPFAVRNLFTAALALEQLGVDISAERAWASEAVHHLISASPSGLVGIQAMISMMFGQLPEKEFLRIPTPAEMMASAKEDHWNPAYPNRKPKSSRLREYTDYCSGNGIQPFSKRIGSHVTSPFNPVIYNGGDWFADPAPFPAKTLLSMLAYMADDPNCRAYAQKIANDDTRLPASSDWPMLVFDDPTRPTKMWDSEPLQWLAQGTGLLTIRESWAA